MDFKDWRKTPQNTGQQSEEAKKYLRRLYRYRVEEQIREAQERGEFDNLRGAGKPLNLEEEHLAGEKTLAYRLLKSNDYAPPEKACARGAFPHLPARNRPITTAWRKRLANTTRSCANSIAKFSH